MEPPRPMCQVLNTYLEEHSGHPDSRPEVPIGSIAESERCGCRYCYVACQTVGQNKTRNNEAVRVNRRTYIGTIWSPTKNGRISSIFRDSGLCFESCGHQKEIFVNDRADDPVIPVAASISGYTGSEQSFQIADQWFRTCIKEHTSLCPRLVTLDGQPILPKRVIDIEFYDSQDVKLIETEGKRGCYACLSHCWGGEQPLKTTLDPDTLTQYEQRIEWDLLPKTFQDAITFSRFFGAQYLWIDSLCIIQDSRNDWRAQSALMVEIYQNAAITIAGSASSGPHQGLFRTAKSEHIDEPLIATESFEGLDKIRSREPLSHDASELPLMQRGWVFQERLLSPRYLHFGQNELIWECMERLTCECGTLNLQESDWSKWLEPKNRLNPDSLQYLLKNKPHSITTSWRAAVVDYSRMKLSHPEDLFLSISGIAKCVQEATGWQYVAGMWKETLITDLVWRTVRFDRATRCKDWRAPTFSWASVVDCNDDGEKEKFYISYDLMDIFALGLKESSTWSARTNFYTKVIEASCEPVGQDVTGQLRSGFIVLQGTLIKATLQHFVREAWGHWCIVPLGKQPLSDSFTYQDFNFDSPEYGIRNNGEVYCLKLIGSRKPVHPRSREFLLYLMLRKVSVGPSESATQTVPLFERIGLLRDPKALDELQLEDASDESAIQREVCVKIV